MAIELAQWEYTLMFHKSLLGSLLVAALVTVGLHASAPPAFAADDQVLIHVKTALDVDDAQICAAPNVAWAALVAGKHVTLLFDASGVTSVAKGFGWRGWLGSEETAMDRAALPDRERRSLSEQFNVDLDSVPRNYGEYLRFLEEKGVAMYYNRTMALLYNIDPKTIDSTLKPLGLKEMTSLLSSSNRVIVY